MNLIVFDIDGTLTCSAEMDSNCFVQAIYDTLGIKNLNTDWYSYRYSTDVGLVQEIYEAHLKRLPTKEESDLIQDCFVNHLTEAFNANPDVIRPIHGAEEVFHRIHQLSNWHIGIATGGWKKSALFKLHAAKIQHEGIAKAFADDHIERTGIIKVAIQKAQEMNGVKQYEKLIYVGDKHWDRRAAAALGIGFIGVGEEFIEGDHCCIDDYKDQDRFFEHLHYYTR